jgi:antitoxin component of RelBE/YafQ-DinJ toxin-antitoxin module
VTLRLNKDAISYFKALAAETGIPYQNLINLYLTECAHSGKKLALKWIAQARPARSRGGRSSIG